jgi:hypothetical protein
MQNLLSYFLLLFFGCIFFGCKSTSNKSITNECYVFSIEYSSEIKTENFSCQSIIDDFNNTNTNHIDILRVEIKSGYSSYDNIKRVTLNDSIFIQESNKTSRTIKNNINFHNNFATIKNNYKSVVCYPNSSFHYSYIFFIKTLDKIEMTFQSDIEISKLKSRNDLKEIEIIELFEKL